MRIRLVLLTSLSAVIISGCSFIGSKVYKNPNYKPADIGYLQVGMPGIPNLPDSDWLNSSPGIVDSLSGKVVLCDFWDYTCVNCLRTLPYLEEWYKRYSQDGLVIIGIHSPEFAFAQKRANLEMAVRSLGIKYPVVMDNDFSLWKEFGNQSWPEEYLFDQNGVLRYNHIGEGEYGNTEEMIQRLLKDKNPHLKFPSLMNPVTPTDEPGAVCYLPTAETYLGFGSGDIGNDQGYKDNHLVDYRSPRSIKKDRFYLAGKWEIRRQYVRYAGKPGTGKLILDYAASSVNLVVRPDFTATNGDAPPEPFDVYVYLDGLPVPEEDRPSGMKSDSKGDTYLKVTVPKMYDLITGKKFGRHILTLVPQSDAFTAYSFTFGTVCAEPGS